MKKENVSRTEKRREGEKEEKSKEGLEERKEFRFKK